MLSSVILRRQIETALASRIPSALTPAPRMIRPVAATGIQEIDALLEGGLPLGAITEMVGPECSGRTSVALSFIARVTQEGKVCAWVDVSDMLQPESAASASVDLSRLLWVRCGARKRAAVAQPPRNGFAISGKYLVPAPIKKGLHGGGCGGHPRNEVKGVAEAVGGLLHPESFAPRCAEPQRRVRPEKEVIEPNSQRPLKTPPSRRPVVPAKPWSRIEQAIRVTDLLLQAGGFSAIVLDMASIAPEYALRVPLATWFRYRAAAERTQASILLMSQHPCAKSSSELLLRFQPGNAQCDEATVFTGVEHRLEVERRRFTQTSSNVVPMRKPPQSVTTANWRSQTIWTSPR